MRKIFSVAFILLLSLQLPAQILNEIDSDLERLGALEAGEM